MTEVSLAHPPLDPKHPFNVLVDECRSKVTWIEVEVANPAVTRLEAYIGTFCIGWCESSKIPNDEDNRFKVVHHSTFYPHRHEYMSSTGMLEWMKNNIGGLYGEFCWKTGLREP